MSDDTIPNVPEARRGRRSTDRASLMQGLRTLTFGLAALATLLAGLWLVDAAGRGAVFGFFAAGIAGLMAAVAGKAAVDALSVGDGVKGSISNLMTSKQPGEPPVTP